MTEYRTGRGPNLPGVGRVYARPADDALARAMRGGDSPVRAAAREVARRADDNPAEVVVAAVLDKVRRARAYADEADRIGDPVLEGWSNGETFTSDDLRALAAVAERYVVRPLEVLGAQAATIPGARASDPSTSHAAAAHVNATPTARNQLGRLLLAYLYRERDVQRMREAQGVTVTSAPYDPTMTSEEAAERARIPRGSEFAKRCSDLAALGYIRVARDEHGHERTRQGASGRQRLVYELTDAGRELARGIEVRAL